MAGEISAIIAEEAFDDLDGPIVRVTAPDTPVPYAATLEDAFIPQVEDVVRAARAGCWRRSHSNGTIGPGMHGRTGYGN